MAFSNRGKGIPEVIDDFVKIISERNSLLYDWRTITPNDSVSSAVSAQTFDPNRYPIPHTTLEFINDASYLLYDRYQFVAVIGVALGAVAAAYFIVTAKQPGATIALILVAYVAGLLLSCSLFMGYISYVYGIYFIPGLQFIPALAIALVVLLVFDLTRSHVAATLLAAASIGAIAATTAGRSDGRFDNPKWTGAEWVNTVFFKMLTKDDRSSMVGARIASNVNLHAFGLSLTQRKPEITTFAGISSLPDDVRFFLCIPATGVTCSAAVEKLGKGWELVAASDGYILMRLAPF